MISLMGYLFDFSLSGSFIDGMDCLWVVRASVFACLIRFRACACVRGSADRFVSTVGSRAFVFAYSIRSRRARAFAGQRTARFNCWIAGVQFVLGVRAYVRGSADRLVFFVRGSLSSTFNRGRSRIQICGHRPD